MKHLVPLLICLFVVILPQHARAAEMKSYKITDGQQFIGNPHLPTILMHKTITVPWKSGRVVISKDPDGTGSADVGVQIEVYGSNTSNSFKWYAGCDEKPMPPLDITHLMGPRYPHLGGDSQIMIRYSKVLCNNWIKEDGVSKAYFDIGPVYIVHFDDKATTTEPFLDLPWGYHAKGNSFEDSALSMSAYFDHTFPLLSISALNEPAEHQSSITTFQNMTSTELFYSSHDGYDWARKASVLLGDPVYAAASGVATYRNSNACGNMILIDHANDYQTRYCHLDSMDLITKEYPVEVASGQMIGRVGMTGRTTGPHIHFMVVQDKDRNGSFDDNIPDGLVDPFGWWSEESDPWEAYTFEYSGETKTGNKSNYLWTTPILETVQTVGKDGKTVIHGDATVTIPFQTVQHDVILEMNSIPSVPTPTLEEMSEGIITSIGKALKIQIHDGFKNYLTSFSKLITITMKLSATDIQSFIPETIAIYSSQDGVTWKKENSVIDLQKETITTQVNHLTQFAIMGQLIDTEPPVTEMLIQGNEVSPQGYQREVLITFRAEDSPSSSEGIEYTLYRINEGEMQLYTEALALSEHHEYMIEYYSVDKMGNEESMKSMSFTILPEPTPTPSPTQTPSPVPPTPTTSLAPSPSTAPTAIPTITPTPPSKPGKTIKHPVYIPKIIMKLVKKHHAIIKTVMKHIKNYEYPKHITIKHLCK